MRHPAARLAGFLIMANAGEIEADGHRRPVPAGQHRLHEDIDRVLVVQIRRDHAHAQAPPRLAAIAKTGHRPRPLAQPGKEPPMQRRHLGRIDAIGI